MFKLTLKLNHKLSPKLGLILLSVCVLQACSLTGESESNNAQRDSSHNSEDIKTLGKSIIELGDIPKGTLNNNSVSSTNDKQNTQVEYQIKIYAQYQAFIKQQAELKSRLPASIHTLYKSALAEMKQKNWQGASVLLADVIQQYPNLSAAYLNKALVHYQLTQLDLAIESLKQAEKVNAINPYIYNLQGIIARQQGRFIEAEKYYLQALTLWPDYADAHLNIAVLFELYRGKFIQAKDHYQAYLALKPDDVKTKQWLAGLEIKLASRKAI